MCDTNHFFFLPIVHEYFALISGNLRIAELKLGTLAANNIPSGITHNIPRIGSPVKGLETTASLVIC